MSGICTWIHHPPLPHYIPPPPLPDSSFQKLGLREMNVASGCPMFIRIALMIIFLINQCYLCEGKGNKVNKVRLTLAYTIYLYQTRLPLL